MRLGFLAVLLSAATLAPAADSTLLKYVMPDAKVVSGINIDSMMLTPFGQFALSLLPQPDAGFQQFIAFTGFDPRRDIHEVVMASAAEPGKRTGLLLLRADFDRQRILDLLQAAGKTPEVYNGSEILSGPQGQGRISQALAFLDNTTAAAGDVDSVKAAIDRRNGGTALDPALAARISVVSANQDAWVVSNVPIASFAKSVPDKNVSGALQGDLIKAIEQSSGAVKFGSVIEISGELTTRTDQDASSLVGVVQFFLNMAGAHTGSNGNAGLAALLQNLTVNSASNAVKIAMKIPEADLENLIRLAQRTGPAKRPRI